MSESKPPPKLFISYSWTSADHVDWVVQLATELRESGVDVILDKWDLKEGHDKHAFMEKMVTDANVKKVVMICDKEYTVRADDRTGGVGAETQIITPEIYNNVSQDKVVAVIRERDESSKPYVPTFYGSRIFIDFSDEAIRSETFDQLLRWVFDRPLYIKPPIGDVPGFIADGDRVATMATASRFRRASNAIRHGRDEAPTLVAEYFETVSTEFSNLRIQSDSDKYFDDLVVESIESFLPYRNEILEVFILLAKFNAKDSAMLVHRFLENLIPYMNPPPNVGSYREWDFDNYRFVVHELYLYAVACFIRYERFDAAESLMSTTYYLSPESATFASNITTFEAFGRSTASLQHRNQRLQLDRLSLRADMLRERAESSGIRFRDLMQADFTLFLKGQMDQERQIYWNPITLIFSSHEEHAFEIFARSESARYFERVKVLLGIEDKNALGKLFAEFDQNPGRVPMWQHHRISPRELLGYHRLASRL